MKKYKPISKCELEKLPQNIAKEVRDTLKVYDRCFVYFQNGKYETSSGLGKYKAYADDYRFIGIAYVDDILSRTIIFYQN